MSKEQGIDYTKDNLYDAIRRPDLDPANEKKFMFQYAFDNGIHISGMCDLYSTKIVEDTGLITEKEAEDLWDKYLPEVIKGLQNDKRPQMCIWENCDTPTDYNKVLKEIDYRDDLEIKNGEVYKKELTKIK